MSNPMSPAPTKGAIVRVDADGTQTQIPFQYNPATLRRTLRPQVVGGEPGGHSEAIRFTGAPIESYTLQIEIEGLAPSDEQPNKQVAQVGVFPNLYAIECLIYPDLDDINSATTALSSGALEVAPAESPLVLLVLGSNRVVPVTITTYEVAEQQFSAGLNPMRAVINLGVRVLSYSDVVTSSPAYSRFVAYQKGKETLGAST